MLQKRLYDLRRDNDLTQREVGKILGLSLTGYAKYEYGEVNVPAWAIIKLAKHYNVSADYLLGLSNDPAKSWIADKKR